MSKVLERKIIVVGLIVLLVTACFAAFNIAKADEEVTAETQVTEVAAEVTETSVVEYEPRYEPDIDTSGVVTGEVYIVDAGTPAVPDSVPYTPSSNVIPANVTRPENYVNGGSQIWHPANYGNYGSYGGYDYSAGTVATTPVVTEEATEAKTETVTTPSSDAKKALDEKKNATDKSSQKEVKVPTTGTAEKKSPILLIVIIIALLGGIIGTSIWMREQKNW